MSGKRSVPAWMAGVTLAMVCFRSATVRAQDQDNEASSKPPVEQLEETLRSQYDELLVQLRELLPDPAVDTPETVAAKRAAVRRLLNQREDDLLALFRDPPIFALDYVQFQCDTAPRLSGRVVRVGEGLDVATISEAIKAVQPGDTILLADGEHVIGKDLAALLTRTPLADVQIVGDGPERCTLLMRTAFRKLVRVRLRGMTIDGNGESLLDVGSDGRVQLQNCVITNYSGAPGMNGAVQGTFRTAWLIEQTTFKSDETKAAQGYMGSALQLRGDGRAYVRQCQFIDNRAVSRFSRQITFDGCVAVSSEAVPGGVFLDDDETAFVRDSQLSMGGKPVEFTYATDDRVIIDAALGRDVELDAHSRMVIMALRLDRRPTYWMGLLRHADGSVRRDAAEKIRAIFAPSGIHIPEQPGDVTDVADLDAALNAEKTYAELVMWYESVKDQLLWDEVKERWVSKPAQPKNENAGDGSNESR